MLDHQGDMETIRRRYQFVVEELERGGYDKSLDLERQKLAEQLSTMEEQGEGLEQAAERRMGRMILAEIDVLAKHSPQFAAAAWNMKKDVMLAYELADMDELRRAEAHMAQLQALYLQGPEGPALQDVIAGGMGALPDWEGGVVTLPEIDTAALGEGIGLLTDEMLGYQKAMREATEDILAGGQNAAAAAELFAYARELMWATVFGMEAPYMPMIFQGPSGTTEAPLPLPVMGPGGEGGSAVSWGSLGVPGGSGPSVIIQIENLYGTDKKAAEKLGLVIGEELRALGVNY